MRSSCIRLSSRLTNALLTVSSASSISFLVSCCCSVGMGWSLNFLYASSSLRAVSYTHLDVYKRQLSVSVATLCRTARENSGKTVGALALEGRLTQAKRLLAGTDLPVAEVAAQVGIADYNYFSRLFRREAQMSPRRYRAAVREGTLPSPEGEK